MYKRRYYLSCPNVVSVRLTGRLTRGVAAKDVILELLRRLTVKGGVGKVMELSLIHIFRQVWPSPG